MSWSRFVTSDIYTFPHVHGGAECCACLFEPVNERTGWRESYRAYSVDEFVAHVEAHIEAGHRVPPGIVDEIRAEWDEFEALAGTFGTEGPAVVLMRRPHIEEGAA